MEKQQKGNKINIFDNLIKIGKSSERIERKVLLLQGQTNFLKNKLIDANFYKDFEKRKVSSIYFDNFNFDSARDNIDGVKERIKFRIRYYNSDITKSKLEIKLKSGFIGYKVNNPLNKTSSKNNLIYEARKLIQSMTGMTVYPVTEVEYERLYYKNFSNVRCTIDNNIKSNKYNSLSSHLKPSKYEVIEFKYTKELDGYFRTNIWNDFNAYNLKMTKSSKYINSYKMV